MNLYLIFVASVTMLVPGYASAQELGSCGDVLRYTGVEQRTIFSSDIGRNLLSYDEARARQIGGSATLPIEGVPVAFGFDGSSRATRSMDSFSEWERQYYDRALTVFSPAVEAWNQCMAASRERIAFSPRINEDGTLSIRLRKPQGLGLRFQGITYPGANVQCSREGRIVNSRTRFAMPDAEVLVTCRRRPRRFAKSTVTVSLSGGTYAITMPEAARPLRTYGGESDLRLALTSCDQGIVIDPRPYPRRGRVDGARMNGRFNNYGASGSVVVAVNGSEVTSGRSGTPPGSDPRGSIAAANNDFTLPAFVPGLIRASGGIQDGTCESLSGVVQVPA